MLNNTHVQLLETLEKIRKQMRTNTVSNKILNDSFSALLLKWNIRVVKQIMMRKKPAFPPQKIDNKVPVNINKKIEI